MSWGCSADNPNLQKCSTSNSMVLLVICFTQNGCFLPDGILGGNFCQSSDEEVFQICQSQIPGSQHFFYMHAKCQAKMTVHFIVRFFKQSTILTFHTHIEISKCIKLCTKKLKIRYNFWNLKFICLKRTCFQWCNLNKPL